MAPAHARTAVGDAAGENRLLTKTFEDEKRFMLQPGKFDRETVGQIVASKCARHKNIAVREVDETQDSINHRVSKRNERINRPE